jgi:mRNA-degrading endonuclease RelE of RelBE toxin-antitoxin system
VAYLVKLTPAAEKQLDRLDPPVSALILVLALGRRDEIYS